MDIPNDVLKAGLESQQERLPSSGKGAPCHKLLQAQDYARRGLYDQAEKILMQLPEWHESKTAGLDLKAKIYAQRGRYAEAEKCWMEALSLDPGNRSYRSSLDALVESRKGFFMRLLKSNVSTVVVIVLLLAVIFSSNVLRGQLSNQDQVLKDENAGTLNQQNLSNDELEGKYHELYKQKEAQFLETESSYLHQMENLRSEKEELIRRNEELVRRNKELESDLEVIKLDSYK